MVQQLGDLQNLLASSHTSMWEGKEPIVLKGKGLLKAEDDSETARPIRLSERKLAVNSLGFARQFMY